MKPAGLVAWQGKMICRKCYADHQETAQYKKKVSTKTYDMLEKRRLIVLAVVFGVLALIVGFSMLSKYLTSH